MQQQQQQQQQQLSYLWQAGVRRTLLHLLSHRLHLSSACGAAPLSPVNLSREGGVTTQPRSGASPTIGISGRPLLRSLSIADSSSDLAAYACRPCCLKTARALHLESVARRDSCMPGTQPSAASCSGLQGCCSTLKANADCAGGAQSLCWTCCQLDTKVEFRV